MGAIRDKANSTFRDYNTQNIPATGAHEPLKTEIRGLFGLVEDTAVASATNTVPGVLLAAATTGNVTLSGNQTIDGVVNPATILVKDQTDETENGPYAIGTPWTRLTTDDTSAELLGKAYLINAGTVNGGFYYKIVNTDPITVGVTEITYQPISKSDPSLASRVSELEANSITADDLAPTENRAISAVDFLSSPITVGTAGTPATGTNASAGTFIFRKPLPADGIVDTLSMFGSAASADIHVSIMSRSAADLFTEVKELDILDAPAGLKNLPVGLEGKKGQYLAVTGSDTGWLHYIAQANDGYFFGTLSGGSLTDSTITTGFDIQAKYTFNAYETVSDVEIDLLTEQFTIEQKIGMSDTPATGTNLAGGTLVFGVPLLADGIIDSIDIYSSVSATVRYGIVDRIGINNEFVEELGRFTTLGGQNNNVPVNVRVAEGQYIGFQSPTVGWTVSNAIVNPGWWYDAASNIDDFDDAFLSTGAQAAIRINIRRMARGQTFVPTLATVDRIAGVGPSYMGGYYNIRGKNWLQKVSERTLYNIDSIAVSGDTFAGQIAKIRANTSNFSTGLGYQDMGPIYALTVLGYNDFTGGASVSFDTFKAQIRQMMETQRQAGAIPLLATEWQPIFGGSSHLVYRSIAEEYGAKFIDLIPHSRKMNSGTQYFDFWQGAGTVNHPGTRTNHIIADQVTRWVNQNLPRPANAFKAFRVRSTITVTDVNDDLGFRDNEEMLQYFREIYINQVALATADEDFVDDLAAGGYNQNSVVSSEYLIWQNGGMVTFTDYAVVRITIDAVTRNMEEFRLFLEDDTIDVYVRSAFGFTLPTAPASSCEWVDLTGVDGLFALTGNALRGAVEFDTLTFLLYKSGNWSIRVPKWSWTGVRGKPTEYPDQAREIARGPQLLARTRFGADDITEDKTTGWLSDGGTLTPASTPAEYQLPYGISDYVTLNATLKARQQLHYSIDNYRDREIEIMVTPRNFPARVAEGGSYPSGYPINLESFDYRRVIVELIDPTNTYIYDRQEWVGLWWDDIKIYSMLPVRQGALDIQVYAEDDVQFGEVSVKLMDAIDGQLEISEDVARIGSRADQISNIEYEVIGRETPAAGTNTTTAVGFLFVQPVSQDGPIVQIQAWGAGDGSAVVDIYRPRVSAPTNGDTLDRVGTIGPLTTVAGANIWTDFDPFYVRAGDMLNFNGGANLRYEAAPSDSAGYYVVSTMSPDEYTISAVGAPGFQLQFGALIEVATANADVNPPWAIKSGFEANLDADVIGVHGFGQSNNVGADAASAISTTPSIRHLTFGLGPKMTKPGITGGDNPDDGTSKALVEDNTAMWTGGTTYGETWCSSFAKAFTRREMKRAKTPTVFFASAAGKPSQPMLNISPGQEVYENLPYHVIAARDACEDLTLSYSVQFVPFDHGETDMLNSVSYASYRLRLDTLIDTFATQALDATGQDNRPIWLATVSPYGIAVSQGAAFAVLDACEERGDIHLVAPAYRFPFANGFHLSNRGQALKGEYQARAADHIAQGRIPDRVWWRSAQFTGTTVTVIASAPTQMKFDVALTQEVGGNGTQATDYGIKVLDGTGTLTLSALVWGTAVYNTATQLYDSVLTFTVNRAFGTAPKFRYGIDFLSPGRGIASAADGNVFDSTAETVTISGTTYTMAHAAPPVEMDIVEAE